MPTANRSRPAPSAQGRIALGALAALALAGCLAGPSGREAGPDSSLPDAVPRSQSVTETYEYPTCVKVWSEARSDSVWNCPDPKPPSFTIGKGG